jgi:ubiquinone/menaquinone biosynthesis C-methylase UbiE
MSAFASPEENIKELRLGENSIVVDLGCGTGHYVFAAAHALNSLGKGGSVYAVDVQKSLLEKVSSEASRQGLSNVRVIWGDIDLAGGTKLGDAMADAVIISNVLFQSEDKVTFLREAARLLKPAGQMMVIDWSDAHGGLGPTPEMLVSAPKVTEIMHSLGLFKKKDFPAGAHHWGAIYTKP